jgi:DoxX-like family
MTIALDIFGALLVFAAIGSAVSKLKKVPDVMEAMAKVGVKPNQIPVLAYLEIAGGIGVILGIWNVGLGILSSVALALYFLGAIGAHLKVKSHISDSGAAIGIFAVSLLTIFFQLKR